jgi:cell division septum initiation protein DivIVA
MPKRKLEQFHQENSTWLRTLDYMEQEASYMKNRLSKVVDLLYTNEVLDWAEDYQNRFLMKEEAIDLMKQDIHAQERRLASEYLYEGNQLKTEIVKSQTQLRLQMDYMENDFYNMRKAFNDYVAHHVMQ